MANAFWDPIRFVKTLAYFDVIPGLGWLEQMMNGSVDLQRPTPLHRDWWVIGNVDHQARSVLQTLRDRGYGIQVMGWDVDTLNPPRRSLIGFVNDTESNETELGWQVSSAARLFNLLQSLLPRWQATHAERSLYDFTTPQTSVTAAWGAVDDVVMGGVSASKLVQTPTGAVFTGNVSTANSGGFVSVRTRNVEPALNLSGYDGLKLCLKGDGNRYKFFLRNASGWDTVAYSHAFDTVAGEWIEVTMPFASLVPVFRARVVPDAPPFDRSQITSFQVMLSKFEYDRDLNPRFRPGPFSLELGTISAYGCKTTPQICLVSRQPVAQLEGLLRDAGVTYAIVPSPEDLLQQLETW